MIIIIKNIYSSLILYFLYLNCFKTNLMDYFRKIIINEEKRTEITKEFEK